VSGKITLQDFTGSMLGITASVVITDSANRSETHNLVLDRTGAYSFHTAFNGVCTATAQVTGCAPQSQEVNISNGEGNVDFVLAP
jgi:hypothetical protein